MAADKVLIDNLTATDCKHAVTTSTPVGGGITINDLIIRNSTASYTPRAKLIFASNLVGFDTHPGVYWFTVENSTQYGGDKFASLRGENMTLTNNKFYATSGRASEFANVQGIQYQSIGKTITAIGNEAYGIARFIRYAGTIKKINALNNIIVLSDNSFSTPNAVIYTSDAASSVDTIDWQGGSITGGHRGRYFFVQTDNNSEYRVNNLITRGVTFVNMLEIMTIDTNAVKNWDFLYNTVSDGSRFFGFASGNDTTATLRYGDWLFKGNHFERIVDFTHDGSYNYIGHWRFEENDFDSVGNPFDYVNMRIDTVEIINNTFIDNYGFFFRISGGGLVGGDFTSGYALMQGNVFRSNDDAALHREVGFTSTRAGQTYSADFIDNTVYWRSATNQPLIRGSGTYRSINESFFIDFVDRSLVIEVVSGANATFISPTIIFADETRVNFFRVSSGGTLTLDDGYSQMSGVSDHIIVDANAGTLILGENRYTGTTTPLDTTGNSAGVSLLDIFGD